MTIIKPIIRYPGGKQKLLNFIMPHLPKAEEIRGNYIEPFLGGGAVFFVLDPNSAILSDINGDLIDLYLGVRDNPDEVWEIYQSLPNDEETYYKIRGMNTEEMNLFFKAARILYLNRNSFKGIWRYNSKGEFNNSYGWTTSRRWAINQTILREVSNKLKKALLRYCDFEEVIDESIEGDFIFADPPYKPGELKLKEHLYTYFKFDYSEYQRLAEVLQRASERGVKWTLTISSHLDILKLFPKTYIIPIPRGTGKKIGNLIDNPGEVLILNYKS